MAGTPKYKVYDSEQEYQASCKRAEDAAALVSLYGDGSTIRLGHGIVLWREGAEEGAGR
jgi:hypothetical protein